MTKPIREFDGTINEDSVGTGGPDQIELDLDKAFRMFDPNATHPDGSKGGIGTENIQDKAVTQAKIGDKAVGAAQIQERAVGSTQVALGSLEFANLSPALQAQILTGAGGDLTPVLNLIEENKKLYWGGIE